ncbi:hypothetical protein ZWY2020_054030 [Hordeum vulgare]|nr:hypothetical protein ZWY2020_054030 [Hordeum vulgare]
MVFWSGGSDSNDHCVEYVSSASDDGTTQISGIPHYSSLLQLKTPNSRDLKQSCLFCAMGMGRPHRGVLRAFEGIHTDRRFLCCAEKERRAEVERKDLESSKLQEKYDMVKNLAVAQAGIIRNMKRKLDKERKNLQIHIDELQKSVEQCNVKLEGIKVIING